MALNFIWSLRGAQRRSNPGFFLDCFGLLATFADLAMTKNFIIDENLNRIGIDNKTVILLDAIRKQRNVADYSGDVVLISTVQDCIIQVEKLLKCFKEWLKNIVKITSAT